jgi:hypothetical protein
MKNINIITELAEKIEKNQKDLKKKTWFNFLQSPKNNKEIDQLLKKLT